MRQPRQRGIALIALMAVLILGASAVLVQSLEAASLKAERIRVTTRALVQAKEALVARAVTDDNRPGSLPCPDTNDDGAADLLAGNACPSYIGRLPWRTLDLPDLRDASGERLWYVLSPSHRDHATAQPINSDTVGMISVTGAQPTTGAIALVIAPGAVLGRADGLSQTRGCPGGNCNNAMHYLDISGATDNAAGGTTFAFASEGENLTFNDRSLAIVPDDVMPLVEKRAAAEFSSRLADHYETWQSATGLAGAKGFYPWAAPFTDPSTAQPGENNRTNGLMPLSDASVQWSSASATAGLCSGVGTKQISCTATVGGFGALLTVSGRLSGVATAFVEPPTSGLATVSGPFLFPTMSWSLIATSSTQALDFTFSAWLVGAGTIIVNAPQATAWTTSSPWYMANEWHSLTYYAVSPEYALPGSKTPLAACSAPQCVTINGRSAGAALVMAGRSFVTPSPRPNSTIEDYLDPANQTPGTLAFSRGLRTGSFNDQPFSIVP